MTICLAYFLCTSIKIVTKANISNQVWMDIDISLQRLFWIKASRRNFAGIQFWPDKVWQQNIVAPSFAVFIRNSSTFFPLHFSLRFDTLLDTDSCSPEGKASATIGSCLNYAKYRIFCAILKVRQFLLWQSLPHSPTGRSCQTPPSSLPRKMKG